MSWDLNHPNDMPTTTVATKRVLISLHRGYGMGDAVQMSAVLRHVARYRPEWMVDYRTERGWEAAGRGLVNQVFAHGDNNPSPHYDLEVEFLLFDTWYGWADRPNTRVASCLHERLGLGWDPACARYHVDVTDRGRTAVDKMLEDLTFGLGGKRLVTVHYQGESARSRKDLRDDQALDICQAIERLGCVPILIDWRDRSTLSGRFVSTGRRAYSREWGRNIELNAALIARCAAFVGIDSGPAKCASATETPSLVVWTGHHPALFHDPAPNTSHLVSDKVNDLLPIGYPGVEEWFMMNYKLRPYKDDLVGGVIRWLAEVLG